MTFQKVAYIRVSSDDQNPDRQLSGLEFDRKFIDYCGGSTPHRPELQSMLEYVREKDILYVHSLDRLARNLMDLRTLVDVLIKKGVEVRFHTENLVFNGQESHFSMFTLSMMGAFAEFERRIILERQREGIELAKKRGAYKGRKRVINQEQVKELVKMVDQRFSKTKIAQHFNMSREAVYKYLREARKANEGQNSDGRSLPEDSPTT